MRRRSQHPSSANIIRIPRHLLPPLLDLDQIPKTSRQEMPEIELVSNHTDQLTKELESLIDMGNSSDDEYRPPSSLREEEPLAPIPSNFRIEMDDLIPILREKATEEDRARAFTPGFTGHSAQLNRDLFMYFQGMANKIPKNWQWAVHELVRRQELNSQKEDKYYRQFETLANHFGFAVDAKSHALQPTTPSLPLAKELRYAKTPSHDSHQSIASLMNKYRINDAGDRVIPPMKQQQQHPAPPTKSKLTKSKTPSMKRNFQDMHSILREQSAYYNGGGTQHVDSSGSDHDNSSDNDDDNTTAHHSSHDNKKKKKKPRYH